MNRLNVFSLILIALFAITALSSCNEEDIIIHNHIGCDQGCVDSLIALSSQPMHGGGTVSAGSNGGGTVGAVAASSSPTSLLWQYAHNNEEGHILSFITHGEILQNFLPPCGNNQDVEFYSAQPNSFEATFSWCSYYDLEIDIIDRETISVDVLEDLSGQESIFSALEYDEMKVSYVRTDDDITFIIANQDDPHTATMVIKFND
jgi:hypothetical protein